MLLKQGHAEAAVQERRFPSSQPPGLGGPPGCGARPPGLHPNSVPLAAHHEQVSYLVGASHRSMGVIAG